MCHCGKAQSFELCCGRLISGEEDADTAENLMRSRYSAFVLKKMEYLFITQDPQTRSVLDQKANEQFANDSEFTGLQIISAQEEGNKARIEFIASYRVLKTGELLTHHEFSQFRKQAGVWYFRQGKLKPANESSR